MVKYKNISGSSSTKDDKSSLLQPSSFDSTCSNSSYSNVVKYVNKVKRQGSRSSVIQGKLVNGVSNSWTRHKKHFFILTTAGKPVWTRYGDESRLSSFMGVIQAIISFFQDSDDIIKVINAGHRKFVFLVKEPLYFLSVSITNESDSQIREQLCLLNNQVISVLTSVQLTRIFNQRVNFDLRRLLEGTEVFLDSLSTQFCNNPCFMLNALQCLRLKRSTRDKIGDALKQERVKNMLYAMIISHGRLVTLLRPKKHGLHPSDLHLLFNMLTGSTTFHTAESWTPLCLPKFNAKGFLHCYICYLEPHIPIVAISTDKNSFFDLSDWKSRLMETIQQNDLLTSLRSSLYSVEDIDIPLLLHFMYKSKPHIQLTTPSYSDDAAKRRMTKLYQHIHYRMHQRSRPLRLYYINNGRETVLGWITSSFELYAIFPSTIPKPTMVSCSNQLLRWIKKNEENLFILHSPVF